MPRRTTSTPAPEHVSSTNTGTTSTNTPAASAGPLTRSVATAARRRTTRRRTVGAGAALLAAGLAGTGLLASAAGATPTDGLAALRSTVGITPSATPSTSGSGASGDITTSTTADDITVTDTAGDRVSVHAGSAVPREAANTIARSALQTAARVTEDAEGKVDTAALEHHVDTLDDYRHLDPDLVVSRVAATRLAAHTVAAETKTVDHRRAVAEAAEAKKAKAAAQAKADAARQAAANTPDGAKATARALMASQYGWGDDQYQCLVSLWTKESGWNYQAYNPSGATGIPQALPGSKMASVSSDWATNATTQIIWGLGYISGSYGTPCGAWAHSVANNWY